MGALDGIRIVVTRAANQAEELAALLRDLGATVLLLPVIGIAPPADPGPLRSAARRATEYNWIIFTSTNGVEAFAAEEPTMSARVAVIGASTRDALERNGWHVTVVPDDYVAESLVKALRAYDLRGSRILIPSAAITRDVLPGALRELGAHVDVVEAYRNILPREAAEQAPKIFKEPWPDWITFASSSAVENLISLVGIEVVGRSKIATIGPVTSTTVRQHGLTIAREGNPHTIGGLVRVIKDSV